MANDGKEIPYELTVTVQSWQFDLEAHKPPSMLEVPLHKRETDSRHTLGVQSEIECLKAHPSS